MSDEQVSRADRELDAWSAARDAMYQAAALTARYGEGRPTSKWACDGCGAVMLEFGEGEARGVNVVKDRGGRREWWLCNECHEALWQAEPELSDFEPGGARSAEV